VAPVVAEVVDMVALAVNDMADLQVKKWN